MWPANLNKIVNLLSTVRAQLAAMRWHWASLGTRYPIERLLGRDTGQPLAKLSAFPRPWGGSETCRVANGAGATARTFRRLVRFAELRKKPPTEAAFAKRGMPIVRLPQDRFYHWEQASTLPDGKSAQEADFRSRRAVRNSSGPLSSRSFLLA